MSRVMRIFAGEEISAGLLAAGAAGLLNGAFITYRKLPPILTTLATLLLFRYGTSIATHARNYGPFPDAFNLLAKDWNPLVILILVGSGFTLLAVLTPFGRWLTAMGGNEQASNDDGKKSGCKSRSHRSQPKHRGARKMRARPT